jgi:hypothetical protein
MKRILYIICFCLIASVCFGNEIATSCARADVVTAINAVSEGGTVFIPTCDPNPTEWTDNIDLDITVAFYIQGNGEANTQITYNSNGYAFDFSGLATGHESGFRGISHLTILAKTYAGVYDGEDDNVSSYIDEAGRDICDLALATGSFIYNSTDGSLFATDGVCTTTSSSNDTVGIKADRIHGGTGGDFDDGDVVILYAGHNPDMKFLTARNSSGSDPEVYIHDITVGGMHTTGKLHGFTGVISNSTFLRPAWDSAYGWYVEGIEGDGWPETVTFGGRDALFFEDNTIDAYCHFVSGFCTSSYVFRYNTRNNDGAARSGACGIDTHEVGYTSGCWPKGDPVNDYGGRKWEVYNNDFNGTSYTNGLYQRAGSGLVTNNTFNDYNYGVRLVVDSNSRGPLCTSGDDCPLDYGYDNDNCSDGDDGCCQSIDKVWIWGNTFADITTADISVNDGGTGCLTLDAAVGSPGYYDETPETVRDGFTFVPYTYPHPLRGLNVTWGQALVGSDKARRIVYSTKGRIYK